MGQPSLGTPRMALGEGENSSFGILLQNLSCISGSGRGMISVSLGVGALLLSPNITHVSITYVIKG